MKYSNYGKKKGFFAGKGFYFVLAVCIMAVGAAAWSAMSTISSVDEKLTSSKSSSIPSKPDTSSTYDDVAQSVSDVSDTRTPTSSIEQVSSEQPAATEPISSVPAETPEQYFTLPVRGNIGRGFSDSELQYSPTYGDMRLHLGVDLLAEKGTDVVSAASGRVVSVSDDSLWGRMVVIDHSGGIVAYYCGLENTTVNEGDSVKSGTKIGVVGSVPSECADESHIHIAVTRDEKYISPMDLLNLQ